MSILLPVLTFVLIIVSAFLILMVLMQKAKSDGGIGSAMGGGMAEATFGAETGNVLSKATINAAIIFFVLSFGLYLGHVYQHKKDQAAAELPTFNAPAAPANNQTAAPAPAVELPAATPATTPTPEPAK